MPSQTVPWFCPKRVAVLKNPSNQSLFCAAFLLSSNQLCRAYLRSTELLCCCCCRWPMRTVWDSGRASSALVCPLREAARRRAALAVQRRARHPRQTPHSQGATAQRKKPGETGGRASRANNRGGHCPDGARGETVHGTARPERRHRQAEEGQASERARAGQEPVRKLPPFVEELRLGHRHGPPVVCAMREGKRRGADHHRDEARIQQQGPAQDESNQKACSANAAQNVPEKNAVQGTIPTCCSLCITMHRRQFSFMHTNSEQKSVNESAISPEGSAKHRLNAANYAEVQRQAAQRQLRAESSAETEEIDSMKLTQRLG
eukprot:SAG31_NODE_11451_length_1028_cov_1.609257_1_plen_318_part_01